MLRRKTILYIPKNTLLSIKKYNNFTSLIIIGSLGSKEIPVPQNIKLTLSIVTLSLQFETDFHSTFIQTVNNAIIGVTRMFKIYLDLVGIGFKAELKEKLLLIQAGFTHPITFKVPDNIEIAVKKGKFLKISGSDINAVSQCAATLKSFKKPDIYKGKGLRYKSEIFKLKEGKKKK